MSSTANEASVEGIAKVSGEFTTKSVELQNKQQELAQIATDIFPAFGPHWSRHTMVTLKVESISRIVYYHNLYQKILDVPGVVCEFGVHWGATMSQLINFRSMYEPFNVSRTIVGFDTFEGFMGVDQKDGGFSKKGDYSSVGGYEQTLERVLSLHESFAPLSHIKKFELVKGDASLTIDGWLENNPHAVIAMAIFDMDLYKPTKDVLEKIKPRLTRGSLLVFDELNCQYFPGETRAIDEVFGLNNLKLKRTPLQPFCAWAIFGE